MLNRIRTSSFPNVPIRLSESRLGLLLVLPSLFLITLLVVIPVLYAWYLSFFETSGFSMTLTFVGIQNYVDLINDPEFWNSAVRNIIWAVGTLTVQIVVGVGLALLLNKDFPGRNIARGAILFPYMIPTIVAVFNFQWMLSSTYGVVNYLLVGPGFFDEPIAFFSNEYAMFTAVLLGMWRFTPFVIIAVLARLQTIPQSLYEAAELDGAYTFAKFRYITLPQLYNVLVLVILLRFVWMFYKFSPIYLLTGGGPGTSTQTLTIYAYEEAFKNLHFGYAATISNVMFVAMAIFGIWYIVRFRKEGEVEQ